MLTEAGGVLNAGVGLANTGFNGAIGNSSDNDAQFTQTTDINDALLTPLDGPQIASNGGEAANTSAGTALVASGNASGTGNQSTTDFVQAASVDSALRGLDAWSVARPTLVSAWPTRASTSGSATTPPTWPSSTRRADGSGLVSNQGEATNDSDGTAIIGNPEDCEDEVTPPTEEPGKPGLPRTGAELETQAAIALMLLLLGFGLRRRSQQLG